MSNDRPRPNPRGYPATGSFRQLTGIDSLNASLERQREHAARLDAAIREQKEAEAMAEGDRVDREVRNLELVEQMVQQQSELIESQAALLGVQRQQMIEASQDRRYNRALLAIAVMTLLAAVVVPVVLETDSWAWSVAVASATLALGGLAIWLAKRSRPSS